MKDHYRVLGVARDANREEIRAAFRAKAFVLHPDRGGGAEAFAELSLAYETLSDPLKRRVYDRGEETETDARGEALRIIGQMMEVMLDQAKPGKRYATNLVGLMRVDLEDKADAARGRITALEKRIEVLSEFGSRFESTGAGPNRLQQMVDAKIEGMRDSIRSARRLIEAHEDAVAILAGYTFRTDQLTLADFSEMFRTAGAASTGG